GFGDGPGNIWVMDADGSNQTKLTNTRAAEEDPAWSPDGERIVFWRATTSHNADLWIMDADGSNKHRLTFSPAAGIAPSWSSNDVIAFTSFRPGDGDVHTVHPGGTGLTRVTDQAAPDMYPGWSPDSPRLVFLTDSCLTNEREVGQVVADGT